MINKVIAFQAHDGSLHLTQEEVIEANTEIMEEELGDIIGRELKLTSTSLCSYVDVMNFLICNRRSLGKLLLCEHINPKPREAWSKI